MKLKSAVYLISSPDVKKCPSENMPEVAFIGRSNVGKSSLINMLSDKKQLAKISATPGKTQMINHFVINDNMYWVDLPGYGFAKVAQSMRNNWTKMIWDYLEMRKNLCVVFVLIDSRHEPQQKDIDFLYKIGEKQIPFAIVFTKSDKEKQSTVQHNINAFNKKMLNYFEFLPQQFVTSAIKKTGRDEMLSFIEKLSIDFYKK